MNISLMHPNRARVCPLRAALIFTAFGLLGPRAVAADTTWTAAGTSDWTAGVNWSGGVPGAGDTAVITNGGTAALSVGQGGAAQTLLIGVSGTGGVQLDGGFLSTTTGALGIAGGSDGSVAVSSGTWETASALGIGQSGRGTLSVTDSGVVTVSSGAGLVNLAQNVGSTGTINLGTGGAAGTLQAAGIVGGAGSATLNLHHTGTLTLAVPLSGTLALNKLGGGTTVLSGSNAFTGTTTVTDGVLVVANDKALGDFRSPFDVVVSGSSATLRIDSGITLNKLIRVESSGTVQNSGHLTASNPVFSTASGMRVVNTGTITSIAGSFGTAVTGYGSSNNFLTNTGGLIVGSDALAVDFGNGGSVTNQNGGTIRGSTTAVSVYTGTFHEVINTGGSSIVGGSGVYLMAGTVTNSAGSTISGTSFNGVTTDPGNPLRMSSVVTNSGTSSITGREYGVYMTNDSFLSVSGTVINSGGSLIASSTTSSGHTGVYMTGGGGAVMNSGSSTISGRRYGVYVSSASFLGVQTVVNNTGGSAIFSSTASPGVAGVFVTNFTGAVTNDATSTISGRQWGVRLANGGSVTNSGVISGSMVAGGTNAGVSIAGASGTLSNSGTINGGVILGNFSNAVTLNIGSVINGNLTVGTTNTSRLFLAGASGTQAYSGAVTGTTAFSGTLVKQGAGTWVIDQTFSSTRGVVIQAGQLQIGNNGTIGSIAGNVSNSGTLSFRRNDTITFAGTISGTGRLIQSGSGALTLTGTNTYSGGTLVEAGTLILSNVGGANSVLGSGTLSVQAGGTLTGVGTVLGQTSISGRLAPGNSPGQMTFGSGLFLDSTAQVVMEIAGASSFDRIGVGGQITFDGELNLTLLGGYSPQIGDTFDLFDAASVAGGSQFDTIIFTQSGYAGTMNYGTGVLTITAVPEPTAAGLLLAAGCLFLRHRRRTGER